MSYYDYDFEAVIERLPIGNGKKILYYNVVILPEALFHELPFDSYPKLRIIGELHDHPIRGAWNPIADGRKYFILSQKFLDSADLQIGDITEMRFNIDDQDFVDVPDELLRELEVNARLADIWSDLTAGKKRFYCYQIANAKQQATRDKRLASLLTELLS